MRIIVQHAAVHDRRLVKYPSLAFVVLLLAGPIIAGEEPVPKPVSPATVPETSKLPPGPPIPPDSSPGSVPPPPPSQPPAPKPLNPLPPGEKPPVQPIIRLKGTGFKMGEIKFDKKERTITFPAKVNMREGNLEYLLVADHGKVHEALLSTHIQPFYLNVVFLLLKFQKAENFLPVLPGENSKRPKPVLSESNSFDCRLTWTDKEGKTQTALLTDWVHNALTKKPVQRARWVYTGSTADENGSFLPQLEGSIIAIYNDYVAMINSPLEGSDNDEIWLPAPNMPPVGTNVEVTLFPYTEAPAREPSGKKNPVSK